VTPTDTSEKGLETLIVDYLLGQGSDDTPDPDRWAKERPPIYDPGFVAGDPHDYDREHAVDAAKLFAFLERTQPAAVETLNLGGEGMSRTKFLNRLQGEIARRGVVDVLRKGIKDGPASVSLFYGTPTPGNFEAARLHAENIFSVTRQLRYSLNETALALDLALFINGLPIATFELKNSLTKQTVQQAVEQYMDDRNPNELLFQPGRCAVHFAVDEHEVRFCTELKGRASRFLPFNRGWNHGAGNPPNPNGIKTDYLWKQILTRRSLTDILENYAQMVEEKSGGKKKTRVQLWPRYHQLDVVRKLLAHAEAHGAGQRYLIQHSAGSGKSNSIAWLAHQLIELKQDDKPLFDSVIVVTDRVVLNNQIRDTVRQFTQVSATVGHAERSGDLRQFLAAGKKIIITTVQKFPFILDDLGNEHRGRRFAIIIDEAHSSQGGRAAAKMNEALSESDDEVEDFEDRINQIIEQRKMLPNASYFAFTATPKNKTLELFGSPVPGDPGKRQPFHTYSMKQAIQEGFIMDVLANYTPIKSWYRLVKTSASDPEIDSRRAQRKLRAFVEGHEHAIRQKAEIMVDHFHEQVAHKINGKARAMVATNGIARAIEYYQAISAYLKERKSPYRAIVAFSGEFKLGDTVVTEATVNGFPSNKIPDMIREEPYRFLIVADKFLTGYDEPLLHTMYVDKPLAGIKAVQTLSRLNRARPGKIDTFVLDFFNETEVIEASFQNYYRTTILSEETDPNKLHDLQSALDAYEVYSSDMVDELVTHYLGGAPRDTLDPILDQSVAHYRHELDEDGQVDFKSKAKTFTRTYSFLASVLPYGNAEWEKLSIYLNFLIPRLPVPIDDDLSKGVLEMIDLESYRIQMQHAITHTLKDEDSEIEPIPMGGSTLPPEPELDRLSHIVQTFNELFGNIDWTNQDRIIELITNEIPAMVAAKPKYQNAIAQGDRQKARIEHDEAMKEVILGLAKDHAELFKQFQDNEAFKRWVNDRSFNSTFHTP
jgi:type I restriction enzyme R subunit